MTDILKSFTSDVDLLLTEVCMTAAMYGLDRNVEAISDHLRDMPRTEGAALLAQALSKTSVRDYGRSVSLTDQVLNNPHMRQLHPEARAFKQLAQQLEAGVVAQPLTLQD
jgi:hypothetical protein